MNSLALGVSDDRGNLCLGQPGPWGRLELAPLGITPPPELIEQYQIVLERTVWTFPTLGQSQVQELLVRCGILPELAHDLAARGQAGTEGWQLSPSLRELLEIPAEPRGKLYHWLGWSNAKSWQACAFRHFGDHFEDWLAGAALAPATIELIRPLVYNVGSYLMFADLPAVAGQIGDPAELRRLIAALAREATLLMQLHVRPGDNLEQLIAYWGRGGRVKQVRPLLESLAKIPRGRAIDVVHLLPDFARRRVFTFPDWLHDGHDHHRDCHWSSLNFFSATPDDAYLDLNAVATAVSRDWRPSGEPPLLGDLAIFHDEQGHVFHSAVYIAGDILFTKNGPTPTRPWVLMPLPQMLRFYHRSSAVSCRYFRRRDLC
ncbi:MAG: hypothetical protein SFU86_11135 [Pirellulaceae bacterium]|nr:hypothetical protein [Pirellulaceae bacterium]